MGTCCLSFGHLLRAQRETFELMRPYCHPEMPHCFTIHYFIIKPGKPRKFLECYCVQ